MSTQEKEKIRDGLLCTASPGDTASFVAFRNDRVADFRYGLPGQMDSEEYGGAPFLGAKQPVIKAHGSSKAKGIKNAIRQAKICVENDLCGTMQSALDELNKE